MTTVRSTFDLRADTAAFLGEAGSVAVVNAAETALEYTSAPTLDDIILSGLAMAIYDGENVKAALESLDDSQVAEVNTGFGDWTSGADANTYTVDGTGFQIDRSGYGYIRGKRIAWVASIKTAPLDANTLSWICIDADGNITVATTWSHELFNDYIVLFECLYDGANYVVVRENHPISFQARASLWAHEVVGTLLAGIGANITRVATGTGASVDDRKLKIVGNDVLFDHGLKTVIPPNAEVTWNWYYTDGSGHWTRDAQQSEALMKYNDAGTPTILDNGKYSIFRMYVSKDDIETATPTYHAVMGLESYNNLAQARAAIITGMPAATNELYELELAQLGYIIVLQNADGGYIYEVTIEKHTLRTTTTGAGATNVASLISVDASSFDGAPTEVLSASDTSVQSALETINDVFKTAHTLAGIWTFGSFPLTPSAAPTADYEVANKKYVDDFGGGSGALDDLTDVTITDVGDDDLLAYDVGSSKWINQTAAEAGLSVSTHIHDDRYYTETESDLAYAAIAHDHDLVYAVIAHDHDLVYAAIAHDHDLVYAAIAHDHDLVYAALSHDHDDRYYTEAESDLAYAAIAHDHDLVYAAIAHDHDLVYAAIAHDHDLAYAAIAHDHDLVYAVIAHDHALVYAALSHDHDDRYYTEAESDLAYAAIAHDHDLVYAAIAHDHDLVYAAIAHDHDLVYAAIAHAATHTSGADDIRDATAALTGLATATQITKLDGIEALADVTDATNVNAAGATMNVDTDVKANGWVIDENDMASDLDTKVPTQQSVKAYVDAIGGFTPAYFNAYRTTAFDLTSANTWYDYPWNVAATVKTGFTHNHTSNPEQITITAAGTYLVTWQAMWQSGVRALCQCRLLDDGTEVPGSYRNCDGYVGYNPELVGTMVLTVAAGSVLELQFASCSAGIDVVNMTVGGVPTTYVSASISIVRLG